MGVPIRDLVADPANRRKHPPRNVEMIAAALRDVGAARSIVIDEANTVLAGNGVLEAAVSVGFTDVRVIDATGSEVIAVRRSGLTEAQKRALALYDNRTAELAEWNPEQLAADRAAGLDFAPWFSPEELAAQLATLTTQGRTDPDAVPPVRPTDIQVGDLFHLGPHRLLCGDATRADHVAALMQDDRADLVFTSPPYAQQRDYTAVIQDWTALMCGVFAHVPTHDTTQILVNLGMVHRDHEWVPYWDGWISWMSTQGWRRFGWYVWDQTHGLPGHWQGRCAPSHEFVFHFNKTAVQPQKWIECERAGKLGSGAMRGSDGVVVYPSSPVVIGTHKIPDSVWRVQRQIGGIEGHPAPFSVALCEVPLKSWRGIVYEPFCGSGTMLVAGSQFDRPVRAMEIEPSYCQVAIDRWEAFSGQTADKTRAMQRDAE